ncbi:Retrovirus-related Pol polyprotein from transposon RE1 [Vitis vinifera]|uniref:Retrovirus-related Pol polyprotein from transposon RE1 n=1 Tax=Vitis vinifera TaxID=29760 RepID=A0A438FIG1_VITVI|nr:Retrovirus-related Pol polyprotein from transposon RE1 [Vitis vinifera]
MKNKRVFEFLAGLNRELDDVRSRVLSRRPLPSIREVFSEDLSSGKTIVSAKEREGLYYFDEANGESVSEARPPLTLDYLDVAVFESTLCLISTPLPNTEGHLNSRGDTEIQTNKETLIYSRRPESKSNESQNRKQPRSCTLHPISKFVSYNALSAKFRAFMTNLDRIQIPKNIQKPWRFQNGERFVKVIKNQGYQQRHSDHIMFFKQSNDGRMTILIVYVDDIVLIGDNTGEVERLKNGLATEFEPSDTPIKARKSTESDGKPVDRERYQRLVGRLIYLSHTRPDIAFAISVVSQHMHSLKESHLKALYKIPIYLKGSLRQGLFFKKGDSKMVEIYTNVDWAGSEEDRRSTTGYCTYVWGNLVTWRRLWLLKLLEELHIIVEFPIKLYCDNKAAISISHNPVQHDKTKHIEVDRHFIKEKIEKGTICMTYIPTREQLAYIFTKGYRDLALKILFASWTWSISMIQLEGSVEILYDLGGDLEDIVVED